MTTQSVTLQLPEPVFRYLLQLAASTVLALRLNNDYVVAARVLWIARQWHPPARE